MRTEPRYPPKKPPVDAHPGQALVEEFLTPLGMSRSALARITGVPSRHIGEIIHGRRSIDTDTSIRFALALGTSARYWLNMQVSYDLAEARRLLDASFFEVDLMGGDHQFGR